MSSANPAEPESATSSRTNSAPDTRSSSPSKRQTTNVLGLGLPELATPSKPMTILTEYPHLGHYVYGLIANAHNSPPRTNGLGANGSGLQHPLSVSSSGESDDEEDDDDDQAKKDLKKKKEDAGDQGDRDFVVKRIVELLDNDEEEEIKELLKPYMGDLAKVSHLIHAYHTDADRQDDVLMDQVCLDCMHKRRGMSSPSTYLSSKTMSPVSSRIALANCQTTSRAHLTLPISPLHVLAHLRRSMLVSHSDLTPLPESPHSELGPLSDGLSPLSSHLLDLEPPHPSCSAQCLAWAGKLYPCHHHLPILADSLLLRHPRVSVRKQTLSILLP